MISYEMSFTLKHISTSSKVRKPISVSDAVGKSKANITYITRQNAATDEDILYATANGVEIGERKKCEAMRAAIDERANRHREGVGIRLADKMMLSLPADATPEEHRKMATAVMRHLVNDSEASALGAIHRDREGNPHLHILYVDGLETQAAAKIRRPEAKRVRRQDNGRLNDGGRPKELRAEFAEIINEVGQKNGRNFAEHRSFKERGLEATPQVHEGVQVREKRDRTKDDQKVSPSGLNLTQKTTIRLIQNMKIVSSRIAASDAAQKPFWAYRRLPKRFKSSKAWRTRWKAWANQLRSCEPATVNIRSALSSATQLTGPSTQGGNGCGDDGLDDVMKLARKLKMTNTPAVPSWVMNYGREKSTKTTKQEVR